MAEEYVGRKFRAVFGKDGLPDKRVVDEIIEVGKRLNALGLTPENAGNISVRSRRGMLITVGGRSKGELTADDVVEVVSFERKTAKVVGVKEPSSETPMHWLVYQRFPRFRAVIHAHDEDVLRNAERLGIPLTMHPSHYGTEDQAVQAAEALEEGDYIAIRNHGILCAGAGLAQVLEKVVSMHERALSV